MADIFDAIRSSCAAVAARSTEVLINDAGLRSFAQSLDTSMPSPDPGQVRIGDDESTIAFVLALDSINFGSGYFPYIAKREGMSGYHTVASSLRDFVTSDGPITTDCLSRLTPERCAEIFGQDLNVELQAELMRLFAEALNDLATFVVRNGNGSFSAVVEGAESSAANLVEMLDQMPFFHDVHIYADRPVFLYKRAQIVAQDLAIAFGHEGPGRFHDIDRLTMFADNLVPHVLRLEGALSFSGELLHRIEGVEDIEVGSPAEIEIRACALHAVELLRAHLSEAGVHITAADLDNVLWNRGAGERFKSIKRHRSRCVYY